MRIKSIFGFDQVRNKPINNQHHQQCLSRGTMAEKPVNESSFMH